MAHSTALGPGPAENSERPHSADARRPRSRCERSHPVARRRSRTREANIPPDDQGGPRGLAPVYRLVMNGIPLSRRKFVLASASAAALVAGGVLFSSRSKAHTGTLLSAYEDARGDQYVGGLSLR